MVEVEVQASNQSQRVPRLLRLRFKLKTVNLLELEDTETLEASYVGEELRRGTMPIRERCRTYIAEQSIANEDFQYKKFTAKGWLRVKS